MTKLPSVSIIIPIYNVENYIKECIESVLKQTYTGEIECVLVDDCGKDHSCEIVNNLLNNYQGKIIFRWVKHSHNKGVSASRNSGIKSSNNDYIFFLDSDDCITNDCIEKLCNYIIKYGFIDLVQSNYSIVYKNKVTPSLQSLGKIELSKYYLDNNIECKKLLLNMELIPMFAWNKLIHRKFLINNSLFFPEGYVWEDGYWTFFLAKHVMKMYINEDITYNYIQHSGSIMNSVISPLKKKSSRFLITSFINNIDPICKKEQKERIFYILKREYVYAIDRIEREYYKNEFIRFSKQCSISGRVLIFFLTNIPLFLLKKNIVYNKLIPILQKII